MIYSMTGFATAIRELAQYALNLDLRSVNHRFLDVQFRLPDELRPFEPEMRELVVAQVQRGKVECRVNLTAVTTLAIPSQINVERLQELQQLNQRVHALLPGCQALRVIDVLRWPNVLATDTLPLEELHASCLELLYTALQDFNMSRNREGEKLKAVLLERVSGIEVLVSSIVPRVPQLIAAYQEKLGARLREAMMSNDDDRIRQEVALFAAKIDIDEELSRLRTHLQEIRRALDQGGIVGKRLDFLMQELNRETNTVGSKSVDVTVSQIAVDIKVLIEQMREQIQNIE